MGLATGGAFPSNRAMTWWEKTVEYAFVLNHLPSRSMAAPLDGNHERAGDTLVETDGKWLIIEFKKDESAIQDERKKFIKYYTARAQLGIASNRHHLIVYGREEDSRFELVARLYFHDITVDLSRLAELGTTFAEFSAYLKVFMGFKKPTSTSSSAFGTVAVIRKTAGGASCMTLEEFTVEYGPFLNLSIQPPRIDVEME